jgi:hypothetical protein
METKGHPELQHKRLIRVRRIILGQHGNESMPRTAHPCLRARNSSPQGGGTGTEVTPAHHATNTAAISRQKRQQCHSANRNNATAKTATAGDGSQQQTAGDFAAGYVGSQARSKSSSQAAAAGNFSRLPGIAREIILASSSNRRFRRKLR